MPIPRHSGCCPPSYWRVLCPESPRWLLPVNGREEVGTALSKLRHLPVEDPVVAGELDGLDSQLLHEHELVGSASV
jgi:hypothetical protein